MHLFQKSPPLSGGDSANQGEYIAWSPDSKYLAIGLHQATGNDLFIQSYDPVTNTVDVITSADPGNDPSSTLFGVSWSPDSKYLAICGFFTGDNFFIYSFDRGSSTLIELDSESPDMGSIDTLSTVEWSPDGEYIALGGGTYGLAEHDLFIYQVLTFPTQKCNHRQYGLLQFKGGVCPRGVGISGSSIANLIIGNTAMQIH